MATIVRFHRTGDANVLQFEEIALGSPGDDEVKLRVEAIGLNRAEVAFRQGRYLERPVLPSRIGYEAAGTVVAVGANVTDVGPGDRVGILPQLSMAECGAYATELLLPRSSIVRAPANVDCVKFAAVWMAYLTAYGALAEIAAITAGDFVIIPAASSSVGIAAIQIVKAMGGHSIATTRTAAKRDALTLLGADHVIVTDEQDLASQVRAITAGVGARIVFDPVAGPFVDSLAKSTAQGGLIIIYGGLSGQATAFPGGLAMARAMTLRGYTVFEITKNNVWLERATAFILQGLANGQLNPVIDRLFPLAEIAEAHRYIEAGDQVGKIVVTVGADFQTIGTERIHG